MIDVNIMKQYIGTGLKCKAKHNDEVFEFVGLGRFDTGVISVELGSPDYCALIKGRLDEVFPILHPLSDLTKMIEIDGEKFVPIKRLVLINLGYTGGMKSFEDTITVSGTINNDYYTAHWPVSENNDTEHVMGVCLPSDGNLSISRYHCRAGSLKGLSDDAPVVFYQKMINQMYAWHFDLDGLIDSKDAVDINSLKNQVK